MKNTNDPQLTQNAPFKGRVSNGFLMLFVSFLLIAAGIVCICLAEGNKTEIAGYLYIIGNTAAIILFLIAVVLPFGLMTLEPNQARAMVFFGNYRGAMVFFGNYRGTFTRTGFFWVNPFYSKKKVSLRARNINVDPIKVNDRNGNPILVGLILVWKVHDVYKAIFEIDTQTMAASLSAKGKKGEDGDAAGTVADSNANRMKALESFVRVQSDAALRQVAGNYAYDTLGSEPADTLTLRNGGDTINHELVEKLNERLEMAGISVLEARINYLAYAPEIAAVMLRRQQAEAIISAREKIVEGAVSMVQMALKEINEKDIVELDEAKKAAMVSNLLVVLCADESAQPVLNTGTLYQ